MTGKADSKTTTHHLTVVVDEADCIRHVQHAHCKVLIPTTHNELDMVILNEHSKHILLCTAL